MPNFMIGSPFGVRGRVDPVDWSFRSAPSGRWSLVGALLRIAPSSLRRAAPRVVGRGPPGQGQRDRHQRCLQAATAPRVPLGQPGNLLDERARAAVDVVAEESAHRQPHRDRPPRHGKIRQVPPITGMHPRRQSARTGGSASPSGGVDTQRSPSRRRPGRYSRSPPGDRCVSRTRQQQPTAHDPRAPRPVSRHHGKCDRTRYCHK